MFPRRYYPARYFAPRFFPESAGEAATYPDPDFTDRLNFREPTDYLNFPEPTDREEFH